MQWNNKQTEIKILTFLERPNHSSYRVPESTGLEKIIWNWIQNKLASSYFLPNLNLQTSHWSVWSLQTDSSHTSPASSGVMDWGLSANSPSPAEESMGKRRRENSFQKAGTVPGLFTWQSPLSHSNHLPKRERILFLAFFKHSFQT